eukprot:GHVT01070751.1.p1 GENE.GHVT01070751.1~~GHVT01070751.1.p1  ORF type:complete len:112 (-),score=9.57 GHVT01070751.1:123-458(-)
MPLQRLCWESKEVKCRVVIPAWRGQESNVQVKELESVKPVKEEKLNFNVDPASVEGDKSQTTLAETLGQALETSKTKITLRFQLLEDDERSGATRYNNQDALGHTINPHNE